MKPNELDQPTGSDGITRHSDPGRSDIVLPVRLSHDEAIKALKRHKEAMESYVRVKEVFFPYLAPDGYVAANKVLDRVFGISFAAGSGFSPPQSMSVKVSLTQAVEVAIGQVAIPSLGDDAMVYLGEGVDPDRPHLGKVFVVAAYVRRMDQPHITKFIAEIEAELRGNSIYRGKPVRLTESGALEFVDTSKFSDPSRIVFNSGVTCAIERYVFGPIRFRDELSQRGVPQKRVTCAYGPFGTGKSTLLSLAAREATDHGLTAVLGGPAVDMAEVMRVSALYQPSLACVEDIDNVTNTSESDKVSELLEAFDGLLTKGVDIKLLMTTNHQDRITPGMLRPGRIDNWLFIGPSDRPTMERLIRSNIDPSELADDVDFDALWVAVEGFTPAYIHEVLNKAIIGSVVVAASEGRSGILIRTDDLLAAAEIVRAQWQLQQDAVDPPKPPTLDAAFSDKIREAQLEVLGSDVAEALLVTTSQEGARRNYIGLERDINRSDLEDLGNNLALYDRHGDEKRGQIVVE